MGSASLAILRDMLVPTGAPDLVACCTQRPSVDAQRTISRPLGRADRRLS
jgi:hypothetical protein